MIVCLKTFTGYPKETTGADGKVVSGPMREFYAGQTVRDLSPEYESLLVEKGLAERKGDEPFAAKPSPTTE